jgi:hypothetical protein
MKIAPTRVLGSALLIVALASPALADRKPTAEEQQKIESTLKSAGYTRWQKIELDDGVWEVDNAVGADGRERDVKLAPDTFQIISRGD